MSRTIGLLCGVCVAIGLSNAAQAADITNSDAASVTLQVTEGGIRAELVIGAGETISVCDNGCFLAMPNGDRAVLSGSEKVQIINGAAIVQ